MWQYIESIIHNDNHYLKYEVQHNCSFIHSQCRFPVFNKIKALFI
jgi:hypothetical protein